MKKIDIKPFRDFWQDCFNCIVYSVIDYTQDVDRLFFYNNRYTYVTTNETTDNTKKTYKSITAWTDNISFLETVGKNRQETNYHDPDELLAYVKQQIDAENIVLMSIDLFHWIDEGLHYQTNHVVHFSMAIGYDDEKGELIVLETGNDMYAEFRVPYERVILASNAGNNLIYTYEINRDVKLTMFNKQELSEQAGPIIASIQEKLDNEDEILQIDDFDEDDLTEVLDIIQTHMFSMQNRCKINAHMFENAFLNDSVDGTTMHDEFTKIAVDFEKMKGACIMAKCRNDKVGAIKKIKQRIFENLKKEQDLWNLYIEHKDAFEMKEFDN